MTTQPPSQIGRYRIERELGRGTMGVVYEARDTTLGRTVALKTFGAMAAIAPHEREAFEQRFMSEARIAATLEDPHVVAVYDVGRDFNSGLLYMALEFVRGETLAAALARGRMPWQDAALIIMKVARALHLAHAQHIVHRDIKPANIMLNPAGEPKIMDFGIAKGSSAQLTVAGQVFGTPAYMSPEQASGEEVDGRSDIFSLGAVLYELVTNLRPFEGPTMAATLTKIVSEEPRPASTFIKLPRDMDAIIARALRKQRDARYDSAAHLASDLECLLAGKPPLHATQVGPLETVALNIVKKASAPPPRSAARASRNDDDSEILYVVDEPPKRSSLRLIAAVATGVVFGIGVVLFIQSRSESSEPATPGSRIASAPVSTPTPGRLPPESAPNLTPSTVPSSGAPRAPLPTPTAPVLSVNANDVVRVPLELRYPFAAGGLRVKVDERVVLANPVNGMPIRNGGVTTGYDGRFGTDLALTPGDHAVTVELRSGDAAYLETIRIHVRFGDTRKIVATVNQVMTLTFE
jgi:serine/threonine-protein kinase